LLKVEIVSEEKVKAGKKSIFVSRNKLPKNKE